jgi:hypothetical protein
MVRLTDHDAVSRDTVGRRLAENELKPWQRKMWCVPKVDSEYVARMEDVLDLYAEPADPTRPVVCFDESPTQLIGEVATPQPPVPATPATPTTPAEPGTPARIDDEYVRNGTANLFVAYDLHRGWRHVEVTEQRTSYQFAYRMKALVDEQYPEAVCIRVVMDNLSTHTAAALYDTFEPAEARRILRKPEIHDVAKHASWLNMVEIEIGVLKAQCLDRRISDRDTLDPRDRSLGEGAQRRRGTHPLDVHHGAGTREARPGLPPPGASPRRSGAKGGGLNPSLSLR